MAGDTYSRGAGQLGGFDGEPPDRIIVASAGRNAATLLTADRRILDWIGSLRRKHARR